MPGQSSFGTVQEICTPPSSRWARSDVVVLGNFLEQGFPVVRAFLFQAEDRAARLRWAVGLLMIFWMRTPRLKLLGVAEAVLTQEYPCCAVCAYSISA